MNDETSIMTPARTEAKLRRLRNGVLLFSVLLFLSACIALWFRNRELTIALACFSIAAASTYIHGKKA